MVGLQTLDLAIGVRVPASQPNIFSKPRAALAALTCRKMWPSSSSNGICAASRTDRNRESFWLSATTISGVPESMTVEADRDDQEASAIHQDPRPRK
jgi:hypothetical protein